MHGCLPTFKKLFSNKKKLLFDPSLIAVSASGKLNAQVNPDCRMWKKIQCDYPFRLLLQPSFLTPSDKLSLSFELNLPVLYLLYTTNRRQQKSLSLRGQKWIMWVEMAVYLQRSYRVECLTSQVQNNVFVAHFHQLFHVIAQISNMLQSHTLILRPKYLFFGTLTFMS